MAGGLRKIARSLLLTGGLLLSCASFGQSPISPDSPQCLSSPQPLSGIQPLDPSALPSGQRGGPTAPISLPAALRLASTSNLNIAQAREAAVQAQARLDRAQVSFLPNFNIGSAYNDHEGNIQKTEGNIITANRDSLFVGGGPQLTLPTAEALFAPLAARQGVTAAEAGVRRVNNDTLLAVANTYFDVLRFRRRVARANETLEHLTDERPSPLRGGSKGLLPLVRNFVERGAKEALPADLERVRVEILRRQEELAGALEDLRVATAELARLIRLDPTIPLDPVEDFRYPLAIPGEDWTSRTLEELVTVALSNRPELAENRALFEAALARVRVARYRPFLPNVALTYNWGDFGGGPDLNPPIILPPTRPGGPVRVVAQPGFGPSGRILHFAPRTDFDASLVWRLDNMGLGNRAEVRENESISRRANLRLVQEQDRVVTQVVQADEQVRGWRERLAITRSALFDDAGRPAGAVFRSMRLNFERIQGGEGRPLEVLDSIRGLSDTLEAYGQAASDYDRSRFRLLIVLGLPPEGFADPHAMPTPPACLPNP